MPAAPREVRHSVIFFRTIVSLDDNYSFNMNADDPAGKELAIDLSGLTQMESKVYKVICEGVATKRSEISVASGVSDV